MIQWCSCVFYGISPLSIGIIWDTTYFPKPLLVNRKSGCIGNAQCNDNYVWSGTRIEIVVWYYDLVDSTVIYLFIYLFIYFVLTYRLFIARLQVLSNINFLGLLKIRIKHLLQLHLLCSYICKTTQIYGLKELIIAIKKIWNNMD